MVRTYKRKTCSGLTSDEAIREAVDLIIKGGQTIRSVSKIKKIPRTTLRR